MTAPTKTATGTAVVPKTKAATLKDLLSKNELAIAAVLPKHITAEKMLKLALLAATKTPLLLECDPKTVLVSVMNAARLGLEIGRHAHLVPFKNNKRGVYECVMIPDYRGLIHLAVSSAKVEHVDARVAYSGDEFDYQLGTDPKIVHRPNLKADRGADNIIAFYAVAHLPDGLKVFHVMTKGEVDAIRERSRAKDNGPWVTDYVQMGMKTAVKQLVKYLPQSIELAAAVELDNRAETGEIGTVLSVIDTEDSVNESVAQKTGEKLDDLRHKLSESTGGEQVPPPAAQPEVVSGKRAERKAAAAVAGDAEGGMPV